MKDRSTPSGVERVASSLATEAALTVVAAITGGPLAALLPVLSTSLAARRQQQRVQDALSDIDSILEHHEAQIKNLTDQQYKLINEIVLAVLHTTQAEKLMYLRRAIANSFSMQSSPPQESILLSRIVRDISSEEIDFLLRSFSYKGILLDGRTKESDVYEDVLQVDPTSADSLNVTGLLSLGLLTPPETGFDGGSMYFTAIAGKLIALVREPSR